MKQTNKLRFAALAAGTAAAILSGTNAQAQSSDALLDKLVDKGILTVKEAGELRNEADKDFTKAYSAKSGMPSWVNALKINGDMRARYDYFKAPNDAFVERSRFRYRLRLGVVATMTDNFEVGLRLTSSDPSGSFGGDPISGNSSFRDNGSKKFIYLDQAYGKWSFLNSKPVTSSITVGKMENPFDLSDSVFDSDYTPEGAGYNLTYQLNDQHSLLLNAGIFMLDELSSDSQDPYMYGAQVRWDAKWNKKFATSAGVAALNIVNEHSLVNGAVPAGNLGNTRNAAGAPAVNFNPIIADASFTYTLEHGIPWLYSAPFPIKVGGEYMNNLAVSDREQAAQGGITFGKSGKKGLWQVAYKFKYVGGDSWYEEFGDSDFGAYYAAPPANSGVTGGNYGAGTNLRGHVTKLSYSPYDAITLSIAYYRATLINEMPSGSNSDMNRVIVDAMWKF